MKYVYEMKKTIAEISYSKTASDNCDFGFIRTVIFLHLVFAGFFSKAQHEVQHMTQKPKDYLCKHLRYQSNLQKHTRSFKTF